MNLKRLFMLLFILNTVSFIFVAIVINNYQKATLKLENAYVMQYKSLILAQELRQSSDDLTRMARTYVITGKEMFKEQFQMVLDIRNGNLPRPKRYNGIFWDFYTLQGTNAKLDGEKIALRELMIRANFLESELNLLFASQNESDDLTNLETKAMNAVKGIFQDDRGEYTIKGKPDFALARKIMHSDEYHKAKIRIMKPLDDFYKAFEARTKKKVDEARLEVKELEFAVNVIVLFSIIFFLMSFFIILFRIVYPIDLLKGVMVKLSSNDMSVELDKNRYQDEISDMIGAVQIFKDNTQKLIQSEQQIKLAMREATSANKAKSIFLARMSHELRTPLNAILGFANLLKKSSNINQNEKNNLITIKRSGEHLLNIINEILELSKIEAGKLEIVPKSFNFYELLEEIKSLFLFRCESKGLIFQVECSSSVPKIIKADEQRLRQILINLLGNSLKFTNGGKISLYIYAQNNKLFFEVKDSGIGIDKKDLKKIFKPFEQIKKDDYTQQGTGLGLSITKELISLMKGSIYVKSTPFVGSEFYFSINYENCDVSEVEMDFSNKQIINIKKQNFEKSILVVDDIKENRELISEILQQYEFKIYEASSGLQAIEIFSKNKIDLIFMDILMGELNGNQTIKLIRQNDENVPIIAVSANVFDEDKNETIKNGANDFLSKPIDEKELLLKLEKYLDVGLFYEDEPKKDVFDIKKELQNLPNDFFEKIKNRAFEMDNEGIIKLLEEYDVSNELKKYIKSLIDEFKYQELINLF